MNFIVVSCLIKKLAWSRLLMENRKKTFNINLTLESKKFHATWNFFDDYFKHMLFFFWLYVFLMKRKNKKFLLLLLKESQSGGRISKNGREVFFRLTSFHCSLVRMKISIFQFHERNGVTLRGKCWIRKRKAINVAWLHSFSRIFS